MVEFVKSQNFFDFDFSLSIRVRVKTGILDPLLFRWRFSQDESLSGQTLAFLHVSIIKIINVPGMIKFFIDFFNLTRSIPDLPKLETYFARVFHLSCFLRNTNFQSL